MEKALPGLPLSPSFEDVDLKGKDTLFNIKDLQNPVATPFKVKDLENPVAWNTLHVAMDNYFGPAGTKITKVNFKVSTGPKYVSPCTSAFRITDILIP